MSKLKYINPKITKEEVKISFFFNTNSVWGQFNLVGDVFAQSSGGSGSDDYDDSGYDDSGYDDGDSGYDDGDSGYGDGYGGGGDSDGGYGDGGSTDGYSVSVSDTS